MSLAPKNPIIIKPTKEKREATIEGGQEKGDADRQNQGIQDLQDKVRELQKNIKTMEVLLQNIDVFGEQVVFNQNVTFRGGVFNRTGTKVIN